jgi:hypothetical protein
VAFSHTTGNGLSHSTGSSDCSTCNIVTLVRQRHIDPEPQAQPASFLGHKLTAGFQKLSVFISKGILQHNSLSALKKHQVIVATIYCPH